MYCTDVPDGTHVTVDTLYDTFPIGAVIGSYPHRHYTFGTSNTPVATDFNDNIQGGKLPYYSAADNYVFHNQTTYIYGQVRVAAMAIALQTHDPGDDTYYAVQKGFLCEYLRANDGGITGMNRAYGTTNNLYLTQNTTLAAAADGRTIGGSNYLFFMDSSSLFYAAETAIAALLLDTEALA